jgi:hypothetical protein
VLQISSGTPLAGLIVEMVSGTIGTLLVSTGFVAGALRSLAVLRRYPAERVEWVTAAGFAGGLVLAVVIYAMDLALG